MVVVVVVVEVCGEATCQEPIGAPLAHQRPQDPASLAAAKGFRAERQPDFETTLDGNQVSLEDQMLRMADSRMNYDAAIAFYQKSMTMIRSASRGPR